LLAREATPETEVLLEVEHHDMLHLLILEVAEAEMHRVVFRPRISTTLPFPPVPQDEVIEEVEEAMDRTGTDMFLHPSIPSRKHPGGIYMKARYFMNEGGGNTTFSCNGSFSFLMHHTFHTTLVTEPHERCFSSAAAALCNQFVLRGVLATLHT